MGSNRPGQSQSYFKRVIKILEIIKKILDVLDDIWNSLRKAISEKNYLAVAPFTIGSLGFLIHFFEGFVAAKEFWETKKNLSIKQRNTRLYTLGATVIFAGSGMGLSITLLLKASVSSLAISGAAFFPIVIPALLAGIYSLSLWRHSYILHTAFEEEERLKQVYESAQEDVGSKKLNDYQNAYQKRLEAEREVAFHAIELFGSLTVCIGIALGMTALLGAASVASFGMLPLGFIIAGVVLGIVSKIIEHVDEKKEHSLTLFLRSFFRSRFGLKNDQPKKKSAVSLELKSEPKPGISTAQILTKSNIEVVGFSKKLGQDDEAPQACQGNSVESLPSPDSNLSKSLSEVIDPNPKEIIPESGVPIKVDLVKPF